LPTRGKKAGEKGIALSGFGNRENFHSTTFRQSIGQIITIPFPNLWRKSQDQLPAPFSKSSISSKIAVSVWFLVGRKPWNIESPRRVNFAAVRDGAFG
jgi:hypothetical protein